MRLKETPAHAPLAEGTTNLSNERKTQTNHLPIVEEKLVL